MKNLQKRGEWLKSHTEHVHRLMQESLLQKQLLIDENISQITTYLEKSDAFGLTE